jgi:hypothetical protein
VAGKEESFREDCSRAYDTGVSAREKITPELHAQLKEYHNGPPPQDENGVDLSLIDWMLDLTPEERIERNYQARLFLEKCRAAEQED